MLDAERWTFTFERMPAPPQIVDLIERFEQHAESYRSGVYNEDHKQLAVATADYAKANLQRQIDATDAQIDNLAYEVYGLNTEEIKIVEGATK